MPKVYFIPIAALAVFYLWFSNSSQLQNWVLGFWEKEASAAGKPLKPPKPVSFVANVLVTGFNKDSGKLRGVGQTGSRTAVDFLYDELDFNISGVPIYDIAGNELSVENLEGVKRVHIHGLNNRDGTFVIKKVVAIE